MNYFSAGINHEAAAPPPQPVLEVPCPGSPPMGGPEDDGDDGGGGSSSNEEEPEDIAEGQAAADNSITPDKLHTKLAGQFAAIVLKYGVHHKASESLWKWTLENAQDLHTVSSQFTTRGKGYKTVRRMTADQGPGIIVKCQHKNLQTGEVVHDELPCFPRKKYRDKAKWELLVESAEGRVSEFARYHLAIHRANNKSCQCKEAQLSVDGVPESKQNTVHVVSIMFTACRTVYNLKVIKHHRGFDGMTPKFLIGDIVAELNEAGIKVMAHNNRATRKPERFLL